MSAPLIGSWRVEVKAVRPFTIHGDLYFELHVIRLDVDDDNDDNTDDDGELAPRHPPLAIRVPRHAVVTEPAAGDRLTVSFLMGQVTSAVPLGGAAPSN